MARGNQRPEPGIATDEELEDVVKQLRAALSDDIVSDLYAERFASLWSGDESSEVITLRLEEKYSATKERAINEAMQSPAPVQIRDIEVGDDCHLSFYPTNQEE